MTNRREFLKGTAWMGAAAVVSGCMSNGFHLGGTGGKMALYAAPPLEKVRVGVVGLGSRGGSAVKRLSMIPGLEITALCDVRPEAVESFRAWFAENKKKQALPKAFVGEEAWKALCDWDGVDVIYNATPWELHAPIGLGAMYGGKHVFIEVPAAMTLDECYELVAVSEKTQRHCMQLENCCYGEIEMLALNLCRQGVLGELVHGEGAYIHDLRHSNWADPEKGYYNQWRLKWNAAHKGNLYPTHGLGPICQYMNINRGDRFDYLVSLESHQTGLKTYARHLFKEDSWQRKLQIETGDMNTTLIKTALGRSIMVQHDVSSPRPYSRINLISGTMGILCDYPYRVALAKKPGAPAHKFDEVEAAKIREQYKHPLWKKAGEIAKKVGGHGGMDFLMDLRWAYCLQNGLPLDQNVYDLASWCSLCELTERSVKNKSAAMDVPDFTNGGWKTTPPLGIVDVDLSKMGLSQDRVQRDTSALSV